MCVDSIVPEIIPHRVKSRRVTASELWPNAIIHNHNFIPRHITTHSLSASHLSPQPNSLDSSIRECPCSLRNDRSLPRFVKRPRTAFDSQCSNWNQVEPGFNMDDRVQVHQQSRWSLNAERLPGRTNNKRENHWHNNSENRIAGKRKMCDLNVNSDDNLDCSLPLSLEILYEEDSDETSDASSDSEAYSGPS